MFSYLKKTYITCLKQIDTNDCIKIFYYFTLFTAIKIILT